jgi:hypothetical protein
MGWEERWDGMRWDGMRCFDGIDTDIRIAVFEYRSAYSCRS